MSVSVTVTAYLRIAPRRRRGTERSARAGPETVDCIQGICPEGHERKLVE